MCKFSETVLSPSVRLTGSFPIGFMGEPLTAHGDMYDGSNLSLCSLTDCRRWCPAMDISTPESGSTVTGSNPINEHMWIVMVGAVLLLLLFKRVVSRSQHLWWESSCGVVSGVAVGYDSSSKVAILVTIMADNLLCWIALASSLVGPRATLWAGRHHWLWWLGCGSVVV